MEMILKRGLASVGWKLEDRVESWDYQGPFHLQIASEYSLLILIMIAGPAGDSLLGFFSYSGFSFTHILHPEPFLSYFHPLTVHTLDEKNHLPLLLPL